MSLRPGCPATQACFKNPSRVQGNPKATSKQGSSSIALTSCSTSRFKDFPCSSPCCSREVKLELHRHRPQIEKVGTDGSQRGNQRFTWQGTAGSQTLKLTVPNLGTRGYYCKELPVPAGSQKLEFMFSKLSNYHCKELRIPKA